MGSEIDPEVAEQQLSAYLDGELSPEEEASVRAALEASPELRRRLDELRHVDRALAGLASRDVPRDLGARLRSRIAAEGPVAPAPIAAEGSAAPARIAAEGPVAPARIAAEGSAAPARAPGRRAPPRPRRRTALRIAVVAASAAALALLVLPRLARREPPPPELPVARQENRASPAPEVAPAPLGPAPGPALAGAPEPIPEDEPGLLDPIEDEDVVVGELELAFGPDAAPGDGAIIEVLDWLEHMDELEESGRG